MGFRLSLVRFFNRNMLAAVSNSLTDPEGAQIRALSRLLGRNSKASYLQKHGVTPDMAPDAFRKALPIASYNDLWPWIKPAVEGTGACGVTTEPIQMFLKTSGTTGRSKLLPVTPSYEEEAGAARRLWIEKMLSEDERNALGRHWTIVSPMEEGKTPSGIPYGSNTGRIFQSQPSWLQGFAAVPYEVVHFRDFDLRYRLILRHAMGLRDVGTLTTANPSTVLLLCRKMMMWGEAIAEDIEAGVLHGTRSIDGEIPAVPGKTPEEVKKALLKGIKPNPQRAREVREALCGGPEGLLERLWPELTTVNCWLGGHAPFYRERLKPFVGKIPLRDPGFSASEGFFAIPLRSGTPEALLHVTGPFFEFVPEDVDDPGADTLLAHEVQVGERYRIVVTTGGGLWRYDMRDIVEVTGFMGKVPLIRFLHKAGGILSITGEKITEGHAIAAATSLLSRVPLENLSISLELCDPPRYVVAVEMKPGEEMPGNMADLWDRAMKDANVEYVEKRESGRLGLPVARALPEGAFERWRKRRVRAGAPDGQVKMPPLFPSLEAMEDALCPEGEA